MMVTGRQVEFLTVFARPLTQPVVPGQRQRKSRKCVAKRHCAKTCKRPRQVISIICHGHARVAPSMTCAGRHVTSGTQWSTLRQSANVARVNAPGNLARTVPSPFRLTTCAWHLNLQMTLCLNFTSVTSRFSSQVVIIERSMLPQNTSHAILLIFCPIQFFECKANKNTNYIVENIFGLSCLISLMFHNYLYRLERDTWRRRSIDCEQW